MASFGSVVGGLFKLASVAFLVALGVAAFRQNSREKEAADARARRMESARGQTDARSSGVAGARGNGTLEICADSQGFPGEFIYGVEDFDSSTGTSYPYTSGVRSGNCQRFENLHAGGHTITVDWYDSGMTKTATKRYFNVEIRAGEVTRINAGRKDG